jgi:hypothetical protein
LLVEVVAQETLRMELQQVAVVLVKLYPQVQ